MITKLTCSLIEANAIELDAIRNDSEIRRQLSGKRGQCELDDLAPQLEHLFARTWPGSDQASLIRGSNRVIRGGAELGFTGPETIRRLDRYFASVGSEFVKELLLARYDRGQMIDAGVGGAEYGEFDLIWRKVVRLCALVAAAADGCNGIISLRGSPGAKSPDETSNQNN